MALVVEDGTGVDGANSYVTLLEASAYHTTMGNDWADDEPALIRATRYIDNRYRRFWPGTRVYGRLQGLDWPRYRAYAVGNILIARDAIPIEIKQAVFEAALYEHVTPGSLTPVLDRGAQQVLVETVGPISTTYGASSPQRLDVTLIDDILSGLLGPINFMMGFLKRA
jgi:hypothetical protein